MADYIIKKYSNRKLYDTVQKKYLNLSEISKMQNDFKKQDLHKFQVLSSLYFKNSSKYLYKY